MQLYSFLCTEVITININVLLSSMAYFIYYKGHRFFKQKACARGKFMINGVNLSTLFGRIRLEIFNFIILIRNGSLHN